MKILSTALLLTAISLPVLAQPAPPTLEQQLDSMSATVTRAVSTMENTILSLNNNNVSLDAQVKALTKERDDLKKKEDEAANPPPHKGPQPVPGK